MHVLVTQSYFRVLDPKEYRRKMPYPPIGTLIAAAFLKENDFELTFYDGMLSNDPSELLAKIETIKPDVVVIYDDEFNYLTKMCLTNMRDFTQKTIEFCNLNDIPVITYNSDAMDNPEYYLLSNQNFVIHGEGEFTLLETLQAIENDDIVVQQSKIKGLKYLADGQIKQNKIRPMLANLDELPDPEYQMIDMEKYKSIWKREQGYFSININTSRGCTFNCNWCAKPLWGRTYNTNSPIRIVNLIDTLKRKYGIEHIWFTDDIFGMKKSWLTEFSTLIVEKNLSIKFKCLSRADLIIQPEVLKNLKRAGCDTIWVGVESGSQKILDAMEKGVQISQIYKASELANKYEINLAFFIQFGYLGETWEDINLTRKLIKDLLPIDIGISVSYPLPGTKFYDIVHSRMDEKQNWTDSDDLDLLFPGNYSSKFYKDLHRLVHAEYRLHKYLRNRNWRKLPHLGFNLTKFLLYRLKIELMKNTGNENRKLFATPLNVI